MDLRLIINAPDDSKALVTAARSSGLDVETWASRVLLRIARMNGMPAGVLNPDFDVVRCPQCGHERTVKAT